MVLLRSVILNNSLVVQTGQEIRRAPRKWNEIQSIPIIIVKRLLPSPSMLMFRARRGKRYMYSWNQLVMLCFPEVFQQIMTGIVALFVSSDRRSTTSWSCVQLFMSILLRLIYKTVHSLGFHCQRKTSQAPRNWPFNTFNPFAPEPPVTARADPRPFHPLWRHQF